MNTELNFLPDKPDFNIGYVLWVVLRKKENPHFTKKHHTVCYKTVFCKQDVYNAIENFKHIPNCRMYVFVDGYKLNKCLSDMVNRISTYALLDSTLIKDPSRMIVSCQCVPNNKHIAYLLWDFDEFDKSELPLQDIVDEMRVAVEEFLAQRPLDKRQADDFIVDAYETKNGYHVITKRWHDTDFVRDRVKSKFELITDDTLEIKPSASSLVYYSQAEDFVKEPIQLKPKKDKKAEFKNNFISLLSLTAICLSAILIGIASSNKFSEMYSEMTLFSYENQLSHEISYTDSRSKIEKYFNDIYSGNASVESEYLQKRDSLNNLKFLSSCLIFVSLLTLICISLFFVKINRDIWRE